MGSGITALGSGITSHGIRISSFLEGSGSSIFVGSGNKMCHAFGINEDQKFGYKNGISI